MKAFLGNPLREAHAKTLRTYEWTAPAGTKPADVLTKAEKALGLKLAHRGDFEQHGFITTTDNGVAGVHVTVTLYEACDDPACLAGHGAVKLRRAPDPTAPKLKAMETAIGRRG